MSDEASQDEGDGSHPARQDEPRGQCHVERTLLQDAFLVQDGASVTYKQCRLWKENIEYREREDQRGRHVVQTFGRG